jgi:hypothetical protein
MAGVKIPFVEGSNEESQLEKYSDKQESHIVWANDGTGP